MALKLNPITGQFNIVNNPYTPATKVVAPSGYAHKADYYTTGTADDVKINLALAAVNALGGGTVKLVEGYTYTISAPLVIYSNTTLLSFGATIVLAPASSCNMLIDSAHSSGSGSVSNITVEGGIWDRGGNGGVVGLDNMSMILGGSNLKARNLQFKSTGGKYSLLLQNTTDFVVENIFLNNVNSDGVHVDGPAIRGVIRNIYGQTGDDLVALMPNDWTAYTFSNPGDITDIIIENIIPNSCPTNAVKVLAGTNGATLYNTKRITVKNVAGTMATGWVSAVYVGDDTAQANTTGGNLDDITVDSVKTTGPDATSPIVFIQQATTSPIIQTIKISTITVNSDCLAVVQLKGASVRKLLVDKVSGTTATTPMNACVYLTDNTVSKVNDLLIINNVAITYAGTNGGQILKARTTGSFLQNVYMTNIYLNNGAQLADIITNVNFYLENIRLISNTDIVNIRTPAVVVIKSCVGLYADTTSSTITATATIESNSLFFPLDILNAQVAVSKGDMAYNTNAAAATGIGSVAYNGSNWEPMALTQDLYSTSSPTFVGLSLTGAITNATGVNGLVITPNTGTITTGVWNGSAIPVANGGTGQITYTDGQLLIGNSTGNTLAKSTLTGSANQITVTNGNGSITLATPQNIHSGASPTFVGLTLSGAVTNTIASAANLVPLTLTQNDATNNPDVLDIVNAGTGSAISIQTKNVAVGTNATAAIRVLTTDTMAVDKGGKISLGGYSTGTTVFSNFAGIAGRKENSTDANTRGYLQFVVNDTEKGRIDSNGHLGIGVTTVSSFLHLKAGTATANTAPLQFNSGTLETSPRAGVVEFLTDAWYGTITTGTVRGIFGLYRTARATGQTAANTSVLTYTLPAVDASFIVSANVLVTTSSAENFTVTVSYTDDGNTARVLTLNFSILAGTLSTAINFANGAVPYEGIPLHIRCKASTAITVKTAGTFTGATYNVEGMITQIA